MVVSCYAQRCRLNLAFRVNPARWSKVEMLTSLKDYDWSSCEKFCVQLVLHATGRRGSYKIPKIIV